MIGKEFHSRMLDTVVPLLYTPRCAQTAKWIYAYSMAFNTVWWDAQYAWNQCDPLLLESQWKQYAGSQHHWWTRCMFTRYPKGGIWDWHCDQDVILISRGQADNHATRTVHAVIKGRIEIQTMDRTFAVKQGYGVQFASTASYCITADRGTECVSVWGMQPYQHYPQPPPQPVYKKRDY